MSTETQKAKKSVDKSEGKLATFVITKSGTMILGQELLCDKWLALLCEAMATYDNLNSAPALLVLRNDGFPDESFGMTYADTYSISLNLKRMWDEAVEVMKSGEKHLSMSGILLVNLLSTIGHEMDHISVAIADREMYELMRSDEKGQKDLESSASDNEVKMTIQIARDFDTDMPKAGKLGWFGIKMMELFTGDQKDEEWVVRARKMEEEGLVYHDEASAIKHYSFRDFVGQAYEMEATPNWEQPVAHVNLETYLEDGSVKLEKAELAPEPQVKVVEPAEHNATVVQAQANNMFILSDEDDDGTLVDDTPEELAEELSTNDFVGDETAALMADKTPVGSPAQVAAATHATPVAEPATPDPQAGEAFVPPPVPDTEPVAEQKAAFVAAAATAQPEPKPVERTFTPVDAPVENIQNCMKTVYQLLYHHTFTKCGWQQDPQTGRHKFTKAASVLTGVDVRKVVEYYGCEGLIQSYDTTDANGKYGAEEYAGMIRGHVCKNAGIPRYVLYLNLGGHRYQRTFVPQNPEKRNSQNAYSTNAIEAQGGHHIAYVLKGEVHSGAGFTEKCSVVIKDNEYEVLS